jgi:tetratricopeptide (TPR) repeat protein
MSSCFEHKKYAKNYAHALSDKRRARDHFPLELSPELPQSYNALVKGKELSICLILFLALYACGREKAEKVPAGDEGVNVPPESILSSHPSGTLGIFTSLYLSQGLFFPTRTATEGITSTLTVVKGQEQPLTDKTFLLLQQLASTLEVNLLDTLNRSGNRLETLDRYTEALSTVTENAEKRREELKVYFDRTYEEEKAQRRIVQDIEKEINTATREKNFATASAKQGELMKAQNLLAGLELKEKQTKDAIDQFQKLIELAKKRLSTIKANREILLSGLSISDVPGLQELGVVKEEKKTSTW